MTASINHIRHILIVDDEEAFLNTLKRHLRREGFELSTAADGVMARSAIVQASLDSAAAPIDLVITDMVMPRLDGIALLDIIKRDYPSISTIMLTGFGDTDVVSDAIRPDMDAFCQKPITPDELMGVIRTIDSGRGRMAHRIYRDPVAPATDGGFHG